MFPAGSSPLPPIEEAEERREGDIWLKSSTYVEKPPAVTRSDAIPSKSESKRSDRSRKREAQRALSEPPSRKPFSLKKAVFLEDIPDIKQKDAYHVDRTSNKEIYTFGCIFEKHVARFRLKPKTPILGFRNLRLCDLRDDSQVRTHKGVKKSRYFSKHSRSIVAKSAKRLATGPILKDLSDVIPLSLDPVVTETCNTSDSTLTLCEDLNRRVYDTPTDLKSWMQLIDIQAKEAAFLHLPNLQFSDTSVPPSVKISDRLLLLKKQLSMVERALSSNPGCLTLKILAIRIGELAAELEFHGASSNPTSGDLFQPERIARDWAQLAFTYPQLVFVWRGYLAHLMSKYASPLPVNQTMGAGLFSRIDGVYKRALTTLSGIISGRLLSHRPQPDTAEQTIDLLADYCHWLVQAGHAERALALWQAVVEFNCFRPPELLDTPTDQCLLELELFWSSGAARFGQPGSEHWSGWYKVNRQGRPNKGKDLKPVKKSKKSSGLYPLEEIQHDATGEQLQSKWSEVSQRLKSISNSCEDALIQCTTESLLDESQQKTEFDVVPAVLSSAVATEQWVRRGAVPSLTGHAPIGKSRAVMYRRGKAWVGLERAREAVGWLPSDVLGSGANQEEEEEDPERLVLFDDIKTCLVELHCTTPRTGLDGHADKQSRLIALQQRLLLHCLEFLGAYEPNVAAKYQLPPDLRVSHDLSHLGPIERQSLSPFMDNNFSSSVLAGTAKDKLATFSGNHQDIWIQARRCVLDTALMHTAQLSPVSKDTEAKWAATLGRIRLRVALDRLLDGMQAYNLSCKVVATTWRHFGRGVLSIARNQHDLEFWTAYATGFWRAATIMGTYATDPADVQTLLTEARRIFDTTLTTYPVPSESACPGADVPETQRGEFFCAVLAPRLKVVQHYIDFELGVSSGAGGSKHLVTDEFRALQLLVYAASGGSYTPPDAASVLRPSTLVRTSHAYAKWLEGVWRMLVAVPEDSGLDPFIHGCLANNLTSVTPVLAYLSMMFDLLTSDQRTLSTSLASILNVLNRIDRLRTTLATTTRDSRWSAAGDNEHHAIPQRVCCRAFIDLALGGLSAFSALRQRNRSALLTEFFRLWQCETSHPENAVPKDLLFPTQLAYLLPAKIALDKSLLPLSLDNASACHGLLSPIFLTRLMHQFNDFKEQVTLLAAQTRVDLTVTGPRSTQQTQRPSDWRQEDTLCGSNVKMLSGHQLDLYANCLPVALDLFLLALELERWTSLLAGSSLEGLPIRTDTTSSQRVRNSFERAVRASPFLAPLLSDQGHLYHIALTSCTPSFWASHLRLVIWRAYMAFGWMSGASVEKPTDSQDPRQRRQAVKAVFYRAIEDLPWAKVFYTDLVRYCPEDVEEVVDLLSERELRLRTPLEEVDLLLSSKPMTDQ